MKQQEQLFLTATNQSIRTTVNYTWIIITPKIVYICNHNNRKNEKTIC